MTQVVDLQWSWAATPLPILLRSNPYPSADCKAVTMIACLLRVRPSSPCMRKAAVRDRSIPSMSNNWKCGWTTRYRSQDSAQRARAVECSSRPTPASRVQRPFLTSHASQSRGSIQSIVVSCWRVIWLNGTSSVVPCFFMTWWVSRSEFSSLHLAHLFIPVFAASAWPMSWTTAWAVRIWLLQVASDRQGKASPNVC